MEYRISALTRDAEDIRREVFVEEQGFSNEFDETDRTAEHIVFYEKDIPAAVCRFYQDTEEGVFVAGRIAVRKKFRGRHLEAILCILWIWKSEEEAAAEFCSPPRNRRFLFIRKTVTAVSVSPISMNSVPIFRW